MATPAERAKGGAVRRLWLPALAALLLLSGPAILPEAQRAGETLLAREDPAALAAWRLARLPDAAVPAALEAAIAADDPELAASLTLLAEDRRIALSPGLRARVEAAQEFSVSRAASEAWAGFSAGDAGSVSGLMGSAAADFTGYGDLRVLAEEGAAYLAGGEVDEVALGLAAVGLGLTAATIATFGAAAPARLGVSALKAANRAGRLSPPLRAELAGLTRQAIDRNALETALGSLARFELSTARAAGARLLRPEPAAALRGAAENVGAIGGALGYRGMTQSLSLARNTGDLRTIRTLAERFGARSRAVLALLGAGALSAAGLLLTLAGWTIAGGVWLLLALFVAVRLATRILRRLARSSPGGPVRRGAPLTGEEGTTQRPLR